MMISWFWGKCSSVLFTLFRVDRSSLLHLGCRLECLINPRILLWRTSSSLLSLNGWLEGLVG